jgi:hypothetical protein
MNIGRLDERQSSLISLEQFLKSDIGLMMGIVLPPYDFADSIS